MSYFIGTTTMRRFFAIAMATVAFALPLALQAQTPPVQPKVQEAPLPPAITLPAPENIPPDVPNRPLTADEAASIALNHQPSIRVARAGIEAAQGRVQQAKSGLLPSVNTGASYTNTALSPTPKGTTVSTATASGYQATANLRQLVYDFNHTRDIVRQASAQVRSANANLTRVESDLIFQVKLAFYTYAQNQRLVAVNEANLTSQQNQLAASQARLNTGLGLPADVVRAQTAVSNAVFSLNLARNIASISRTNLAQLMGIDPRTPIEAADTSEPAIQIDDVNKLVDQALAQRPEIKQAQQNVQAAAYGVNVARTSNSPSIGATAGWLQKGSNFPPDNNSLTYGVAIQWTPFDSGLTKGRVKEAQANYQSLQAQLDALKLSITTEVSQAYLNLMTAEQRVITADAEISNAEEALRLVEGRYQSGLGTFLDVLDAQTALLTAKTNRVNAQSAADQARAAMLHAVGAQCLQQVASSGKQDGKG